jgi:hypothetical protein
MCVVKIIRNNIVPRRHYERTERGEKRTLLLVRFKITKCLIYIKETGGATARRVSVVVITWFVSEEGKGEIFFDFIKNKHINIFVCFVCEGNWSEVTKYVTFYH